ncbi:MAG TPA: hypothetical protein VF444_01335, partial [Pseudonocardiaceae bacterium]
MWLGLGLRLSLWRPWWLWWLRVPGWQRARDRPVHRLLRRPLRPLRHRAGLARSLPLRRLLRSLPLRRLRRGREGPGRRAGRRFRPHRTARRRWHRVPGAAGGAHPVDDRPRA